MTHENTIPAALALEGLGGPGALDARGGFAVAADAGYRGIAFATNHKELNPDELGPSARRHVKSLLATKGLAVESVRVAVPRGQAGGGLSEAATIDRTLENARKGMLLARELGVRTVAMHVGDLTRLAGAAGGTGLPEGTVISALRELAQQADAAGLTLALSAEGAEAFARILKGVDFDRAKVNLDGARLIGAGEDALKVAEEFHGEIGQFTADDAVRAGSKVRAALLGEGQLPLEALMEILREQGFSGPLVVDVRDLPDGIAGARHAAAVLAGILRRSSRG